MWEYRVGGFAAVDPVLKLGSVTINYRGDTTIYQYYDHRGFPAPMTKQILSGKDQYEERIIYHPGDKFKTILLYDRMGSRLKANNVGISGYQCYMDPRGGIIRKYGIDLRGRRNIEKDSTYETTFVLDTNGALVDIRTFDSEGHQLSRRKIKNNRFGQPIEQRWVDSLNKPDPLGSTYRYTYDSLGYTTESARYTAYDELRSISVTEYDRFGNALIIREYDGNQRLTGQYENFYNELHQNTGQLYSNEEEGAVTRDSITYDAFGRELEVWFFTGCCTPIEHKDSVRSVIHYYHDGYLDIETHYRNYLGELIPGKFGVARIQDISDNWGNTIEMRYMDAEGRPTNSPRYDAATIAYTYSPQGKIIGAKAYDIYRHEIPYRDSKDFEDWYDE